MVELRGTRVDPMKPKLKSLLDRWVTLVGDPYWTNRDAPWWYNEAASVSTVAAAAWLNGGRALLDYRATKSHENVQWKGRADIWIDLGEEEYIGEAKMYWPSLSRSKGHGRTTKMLEWARADAKHNLKSKTITRVGLLIISPWTARLDDDALDLQTRSFIDGSIAALEGSAAIAWSFRSPWAMVPRSKGYGYPGVMVALSHV
jgi:hypothetical protein